MSDIDVKKATEIFIEKISNIGYNKNREFSIRQGKKYYKIVEKQGGAYAFVDKNDGNIYKPASWAAPAKHARGNVLSDKNGLEAIDSSGFILYLK